METTTTDWNACLLIEQQGSIQGFRKWKSLFQNILQLFHDVTVPDFCRACATVL